MASRMEYSKVPGAYVAEPPSPPQSTKITTVKTRTAFHYLSLLFGVSWLVPALFILYLNFKGEIDPRAGVVGQSIGCLSDSKRCKINLQNVNQVTQAQKLASLDRDALGGLQLAAKALEIWFVTIAANLIFLSVKILAGRASRPPLPLRYIFLHGAMGESLALGRLLFWQPFKTACARLLRRIKSVQPSEDERIADEVEQRDLGLWRRSHIYLFSIFVTIVSIACMLMGPATAILVLPNIQWTTINSNSGSLPVWLDALQAGQPPLSASFPGCTTNNLTAGNFSCLKTYYQVFVDSLAAGAIATDTQAWQAGGGNISNPATADSLIVVPLFQEGNVTFTANISGSLSVVWTPLRQILRGINDDVVDFDLATSSDTPLRPGYPDSGLFNKSLQARLEREGPTIGMQTDCILNSAMRETVRNFSVGPDQTVRCYQTDNEEFQCIPSGSGWANIPQSSSSFTVLDSNLSVPKNVDTIVYSAAKSLNLSVSTFLCIANGTCQCDWSEAFSNSTSCPRTTIAVPFQVTEYTSPAYAPDDSIWCSSYYSNTTAEYVLDPSQVTNLFRLVELNVNGANGTISVGTPLYIDSDWMLTGWIVDRNGSVSVTRSIAGQLIAAFQNFLYSGKNTRSFPDFVNIHKFVAIQSLSLMSYTNTSTVPSDKAGAGNPLSSSAQIQAWSYGLQSHTSKLGVIIMMAGCVFVIMRTVIYFGSGGETMDATDILQSILMHYHLIRDENAEMSGVYPVLVLDDATKDVGFRA